MRSNLGQNDVMMINHVTAMGAHSRADSRMKNVINYVVVTIVCTVRVCIVTNTKSTRCSSERSNIDFSTNARFHLKIAFAKTETLSIPSTLSRPRILVQGTKTPGP